MSSESTSGSQEYQLPVPSEVFQAELEIKKSKFLCFISRVQTEAQAREFIRMIREMYPDARHHCSAYIYHVNGSHDVERSSDDGEPSGTAGKPMLEALRGSGLKDIAAVVVRYFGGIKLGTGGLVNAYTNAVTATLVDVKSVTRAFRNIVDVSFPHSDAGRIESHLRGVGFNIIGTEYAAQATFKIAIPASEREKLGSFLSAMAGTIIELDDAGTMWVESPSDSSMLGTLD